MATNEKENESKMGAEIFIVPQNIALNKDFSKAQKKFQYGKTPKTSDQGFKEMKKLVQNPTQIANHKNRAG